MWSCLGVSAPVRQEPQLLERLCMELHVYASLQVLLADNPIQGLDADQTWPIACWSSITSCSAACRQSATLPTTHSRASLSASPAGSTQRRYMAQQAANRPEHLIFCLFGQPPGIERGVYIFQTDAAAGLEWRMQCQACGEHCSVELVTDDVMQ